MDFSTIITHYLDKQFYYIRYDGLELIIMRENGYVNATELCFLGNKSLRDWLNIESVREFIREVESKYYTSVIVTIEVDGGKDVKNSCSKCVGHDVSGTYVHQDLVPHVSYWVSPSFAVKVSKVINYYTSQENQSRVNNELREINCKLDELAELINYFYEKYNRDIMEVRKRYREQRNDIKILYKEANNIKDNYVTDAKETNTKLEQIEKRLKKIDPRCPTNWNVW